MDIRKVWHMMLHELRLNFVDRSYWIFTLLVPGMMVIVVAAANGAFASDIPVTQRIDIIDNDNSALSAQFLATMHTTNDSLLICPLDITAGAPPQDEADPCLLEGETLTAEQMAERVVNGVTLAMIEIPAGFEAAVRAGEEVSIIYRSSDDPNTPSYLQQTVQAAIQRLSGAEVARGVAEDLAAEGIGGEAFGGSVYTRASQLWAENLIRVTAVEVAGGDAQYAGFRQSVPGMGSMFVMFTVLGGAAGLIIERKQWTLQRIATMPVTKGEIIAGKMASRFVLGMLQYAVAFAIGFAFGTAFGSSPLALVIIASAFVFCMSALTLLLATIVTREEQAAGLTTFMALTLAPLGGAWWPLEIVPQFMQQAALVSPITWAMDGFNDVIFRGGSIPDVLPQSAVLMGLGLVLFALAVRRFRYV